MNLKKKQNNIFSKYMEVVITSFVFLTRISILISL